MAGKAIIGIGNTLMGDDGAGVLVLEMLKGRIPDDIELIELATGGMSLLHVLARLDKVVIVDGAEFGGSPGEIRSFRPDDVKSVKVVGFSLHDWDLFTTLEMAAKVGECPSEIVIVAIQTEDMSFKEGLSGPVEAAMADFADRIVEEISRFG